MTATHTHKRDSLIYGRINQAARGDKQQRRFGEICQLHGAANKKHNITEAAAGLPEKKLTPARYVANEAALLCDNIVIERLLTWPPLKNIKTCSWQL